MALLLDDLELIWARVSDTKQLAGTNDLASTVSSVWVASGLAKISAAYGASLIQQYVGNPSQAMTALDYCQKPLLQSLPLLVSLMGKHDDAVSVAESIVRRSVKNAILITGGTEGPAARTLKTGCRAFSVVTANFPSRDQRFVNCSSIFMLSALSYQLVQQAFGGGLIERIDKQQLTQFFHQADEGAKKIAQYIASIDAWQSKQLIILGQGMGSEMILPWQSIFSEAGIATPVIIDIKDYSHGDHLAAVRTNNAIFLVIQHPGIEDICQIFVSRFARRFAVTVVELKSTGPIQFWENLFYCCNTADALTGILGYAGQRPPKDLMVHGWREWGKLA